MKIYVKNSFISMFSLFLFLNHDFIKYIDFAHAEASKHNN